MVSDYGPAHDAEGAFQRAFKEAGGEILGSVRIPGGESRTSSAFVQRAKDLNPEAIYVFVPGGAQPAAFGKALAELGIDPKKTRILGQGEITEENALRSMGDAGARHHHRLSLRLQPQFGGERGVRRRPTTRPTGATPTSTASAATTACTSSTRR